MLGADVEKLSMECQTFTLSHDWSSSDNFLYMSVIVRCVMEFTTPGKQKNVTQGNQCILWIDIASVTLNSLNLSSEGQFSMSKIIFITLKTSIHKIQNSTHSFLW